MAPLPPIRRVRWPLGPAIALAALALTGAAVPLGALAAGGIGELIGTRGALWIGMAGGAISPVLLLPLRRLERMPVVSSSAPSP